MRRFLLFLAVLAMAGVPLLLYLGRTPIINARLLNVKNPTAYGFHASVEDTSIAVDKAFDRGGWRGMTCGRATFTGVPAKEDYLLTKYHEPIGKSPCYWVGGQPADYLAEFKLQLVERGPKQTEIVVVATLPEVIAGKKFGFGSCGPGFANRYVQVEPTTIEEYEILLRIGAELGEKDMPALILP